MSAADEHAPFHADDDASIPAFDLARLSLYERATATRGPRDLVVKALDHFVILQPEAHALDLGCGLGHETELLLRRGWRVTATDASARMLESTLARANVAEGASRLRLIHAPFERTALESDSFDLVHAGFALPFCPAEHFATLWLRLGAALRSDGLFVGQFFGPDDQFVRESAAGTMSVQTFLELKSLFEAFEILHHEEVNRLGETAPGSPKHWHVHHVIARRRSR